MRCISFAFDYQDQRVCLSLSVYRRPHDNTR